MNPHVQGKEAGTRHTEQVSGSREGRWWNCYKLSPHDQVTLRLNKCSLKTAQTRQNARMLKERRREEEERRKALQKLLKTGQTCQNAPFYLGKKPAKPALLSYRYV